MSMQWVKLYLIVLVCFCCLRQATVAQSDLGDKAQVEQPHLSIETQSRSFLSKLLFKPRSSLEYLVALLASFAAMSFVLLKMHDSAQAKNVSWIIAMGNVAVVAVVLIIALTAFRLYVLPGWMTQIKTWAASGKGSTFSLITQPLQGFSVDTWLALMSFMLLILIVIPISKFLFASSYSTSFFAWLATLAVGCVVAYAIHFAFGLGGTADQIMEEKQYDKGHSTDQFLKEM